MKFLLGIMWCLRCLPMPLLGRVGEWMGRGAYWILPSRRHITLTNLRLCFPDLTEKERKAIAVRHFEAYARSILERGILWWSSEERVRKLIHIDPGSLHECTAAGPVILLCPHFVGLDAAGAILLLETAGTPSCSIYTSQKNVAFDQTLKKGRTRFGDIQLLSREEGVKPIIRALRQGHIFYMLPDMDFGIKDAIFAPFFNIQAATITAPARIAGLTNAKVMPVSVILLPNYQGWQVTVHPAWENFPGDDIVLATHRMNQFIENQVRRAPAEYLWSHRRFKTRPEGEADFYS